MGIPTLTSFYLLVSGIVVVDITHGQLVLVLALLDVVLTLGHLVLQLPHLKIQELARRGGGTPLTPLTCDCQHRMCI